MQACLEQVSASAGLGAEVALVVVVGREDVRRPLAHGGAAAGVGTWHFRDSPEMTW